MNKGVAEGINVRLCLCGGDCVVRRRLIFGRVPCADERGVAGEGGSCARLQVVALPPPRLRH